MNSRQPVRDSAVEEQAALWAARLDGASLSSADRDALDAWLSADPTHRARLAEYCQFSMELEAQLPALVDRGRVRLPPPKPARRRFVGFALYSGLALAAAAVAMLFWAGRVTTVRQDIATAVAQRQQVALADGSRVELNARTTLRVDFTRAERRIQLAEGQAYFSVSKDPSRPFVVETPAGAVRVTGTVFDVRTGTASDLQVTVFEGSVLIRPGEAAGAASATPIPLRAGNRVTAAHGSVSQQSLTVEELADALAWREGVIVFDGVALTDALAGFAHHHGRGIHVLPGAGAHRISGRYSIDDLDGFIGMLDQAFPVETTRTLSGTITVRPRKDP